MAKININDAAEVVKTAEHDALVAVKAAMDTLEESFDAISATLPVALTMDACRIMSDVRSYISYKRSAEIPVLLTKYEAVPAPTA
jgi:phage-related tail fiber protein